MSIFIRIRLQNTCLWVQHYSTLCGFPSSGLWARDRSSDSKFI